MIPKAFIEQQKILQSVSIVSKLNEMTKNGIYLSGFYIDHFEPDYLDNLLSNWSESSDKTDFQRRLSKVVYDNLEKIETEIKKSLTSRNHIITEIFVLFKLKYYSAMITLTLSQVDGIMKEITRKNGFYNSNNENRKINPNRIKYLDDSFYVNFISTYELLKVENRNDYELLKKNINDMTLLNRHAILHGESVEFGHEFNAIKSILLLTLIGELCESNQE